MTTGQGIAIAGVWIGTALMFPEIESLWGIIALALIHIIAIGNILRVH